MINNYNSFTVADATLAGKTVLQALTLLANGGPIVDVDRDELRTVIGMTPQAFSAEMYRLAASNVIGGGAGINEPGRGNADRPADQLARFRPIHIV